MMTTNPHPNGVPTVNLQTGSIIVDEFGLFNQSYGQVIIGGQIGPQVFKGSITIANGGTYNLSGIPSLSNIALGGNTSPGTGIIVNGDFNQTGGGMDSGNIVPVVIGNGGNFSFGGGFDEAAVTINNGGQFTFTGGTTFATDTDGMVSITLNAGGTLTTKFGIGGSDELIATDLIQAGGSNTSFGDIVLGLPHPAGAFGSLIVPGNYQLNAGTLLDFGNFNVSANSTFTDQTTGMATINGNLTNDGTVIINGVTLTVGGVVNGSNAVTKINGGMIDPTAVEISGGVFGGYGTIVGRVTVTGDAKVEVGPAPNALHIEGAYSQTGGTITFDIDPDGKGGYLTSSLVFEPGDSVSIDGTKIVFDFLDGANPLAFFKSGEFNLDAFFEESDGSLFSSDFNLESLFAGDTFTTNMRGFNIAGFGADGTVDLVTTSGVPEPSTWAMLIVGFAGLGYAGLRRGRARVAAV